MSALVTDGEVTPASLLPESRSPKGVSGVDRIGQRYAPGLARIAALSTAHLASKFEELGIEDCTLSAEEIATDSFAGWCEAQQDELVLFHYRAAPVNGGIVAAIPARLVNRLVDIHFGGTGEDAKSGTDFSPAEQLFIGRLAERLAPALSQSWSGIVDMKAELRATTTELVDCSFLKPHELVSVQPLTVNIPGGDNAELFLIYPLSGLKAVPALTDEQAMPASPTIDPVWFDSLNDAVMQVRLPMRTIFARPEISLRQLMQLKPGEIIPVFMPNRIPMSVSGRLFAHGTVGDSNNRIAVKIEEIEKGRKS